jgi:hypothetical protein
MLKYSQITKFSSYKIPKLQNFPSHKIHKFQNSYVTPKSQISTDHSSLSLQFLRDKMKSWKIRRIVAMELSKLLSL